MYLFHCNGLQNIQPLNLLPIGIVLIAFKDIIDIVVFFALFEKFLYVISYKS